MKQILEKKIIMLIYYSSRVGLDGKTCMYRALCEAAHFLEERGDNLLDEIIKRLFRLVL